MGQIVLGKVAFTPRGKWQSKEMYERYDMVYEGACIYISLKDENKAALDDETAWEKYFEFGRITTEMIADEGITNEKLKDALISWAKLDDNVKNIIASREEGGIALANELGNSKMIGISQWKLTEELNAINNKTNNIADEEDLTMVSVDERPAIQLRDKAYEPEKHSGLGRKYLRKNVTYDVEIVHFGGFVENVAIEPIGAAITDGNSSNVVYDRIRKAFLYREQKGSLAPAKYYDTWTSEEVPYSDYYQSSFTTGYTIRTDVVFMLGDVPYRWDENDQELAVWGDFYEAHSKNILTQAMINEPNTIYHIQYDYDLNGQTITVPEGCTLEFEGGSLRNGNLLLMNVFIDASEVQIFRNVIINLGSTITNSEIFLVWGIEEGENDSYKFIRSILNAISYSTQKYIIHFPKFDISISTASGTNGQFVLRGNNIIIKIYKKVEVIPNNFTSSVLFKIAGCNNVTIDGGGSLIGDYTRRGADVPDVGEWGHLFFITNSNNVIIRDIEISYAYGDGVYVRNLSTAEDLSPQYNSTLLQNTKIHHCRRSNITLISGTLTCVNVESYSAGYNDTLNIPNTGIDIEPNNDNYDIWHCVLKNSKFYDSSKQDLSVKQSPEGSTLSINGCTFGKTLFTTVKNARIENNIFKEKVSWPSDQGKYENTFFNNNLFEFEQVNISSIIYRSPNCKFEGNKFASYNSREERGKMPIGNSSILLKFPKNFNGYFEFAAVLSDELGTVCYHSLNKYIVKNDTAYHIESVSDSIDFGLGDMVIGTSSNYFVIKYPELSGSYTIFYEIKYLSANSIPANFVLVGGGSSTDRSKIKLKQFIPCVKSLSNADQVGNQSLFMVEDNLPIVGSLFYKSKNKAFNLPIIDPTIQSIGENMPPAIADAQNINTISFYYNKTTNELYRWIGYKWVDGRGFTVARHTGTSAERPVGRYTILNPNSAPGGQSGKKVYVGFTILISTGYKYVKKISSGVISWGSETDLKADVPADVIRKGTTSQRPSAEYAYNNLYVGFDFFDTDYDWPFYIYSMVRNGEGTDESPYSYEIVWMPRIYYNNNVITSADVGYEYFDTELGKPIYAKVIDTDTGDIVWVDATGAEV